MKRILITTLTAVFIITGVMSANATLMVDENTGGDYSFLWRNGLGSNPWAIQDISTNTWYVNETSWGIDVAVDSELSFLSAWDAFLPTGDAFSLMVDNQQYSWDNEYNDQNGFYHGEANDIPLTAGVHDITLYLTSLALDNLGNGFEFGQGFFSIGTTSAILSSAADPVPEPTTLLLLGTGLAGFTVIQSRKKRKTLA